MRRGLTVAGLFGLLLLVSPRTSSAVCAPGGVCGPRDVLSWEVPTTNTDGTPFTDFGAHEVLFTTGAFVGDLCSVTTPVSSFTKNLGPLTTPATPLVGSRASVVLGTLGMPFTGLVSGTARVVDLQGAKSGCPAMVSFTYDTAPPETTITGKPAVAVTTNLVSFTFTSSESPSTFQCKVDAGAFVACTSPYNFAVADGPHTFSVRAIDQVGNVDATPAIYSWTTTTVIVNVPTAPANVTVGP